MKNVCRYTSEQVRKAGLTIITAHAGCEGTPANSLENILAAIESGGEMMEIDVRSDGDRLYLYMRTNYGSQYECESTTGLNGFSTPRASKFTSPQSPMKIMGHDGAFYAIYNPIPCYNGRELAPRTWGRTPLALRKSTDGGKKYGPLQYIEDDPARGYCYPAIFFTNDNSMLTAYCRGNDAEGCTLCTLGISKIDLSTIE